MSDKNPDDSSLKASATPDAESFAALFAQSEVGRGRSRGPKYAVGDRVRGKLVSIGSGVAVVELEGGGEGTLDAVELRDPKGELLFRVGEIIEARVAAKGEKAGIVSLRRAPARGADARAGLAEAVTTGLPVEGQVTGVNKGGLEVLVAGARAFCPLSQIDLRPVPDPAVYIGQHLAFRITKYDDGDRRGPDIVLSRRALLEEEARARAAVTRASLKVGAVLTGTVASVRDFGAFIDLGGLDGLLPASEIGFQRGTRPADVLAVGQPVTVQILRIEKPREAKPGQRPPRETEQITLSLKALERDPWEEAVTRLAQGAVVNGKVTRAEAFGAFVEVAPGVEGLLHVSELGAGRQLRHARDAVSVGAELAVTVLAIDRERRRLSLGLASAEDRVDDEGRAAVARGAAAGMGTFGDLLKAKLSERPR